MRGQHGLTDLDDLINQTREQQAATLQEVEWRDRKLAVKQEKVRIFLLREQEFAETELKDKDAEERISAYESLLMDCKDAIQVNLDRSAKSDLTLNVFALSGQFFIKKEFSPFALYMHCL